MLPFFFLLGLIAVGLIAKRYFLHLAEQKLRDNPPERALIEVALPRGINNSPELTAKYLRKIASVAQGDAEARKLGKRQIDIVWFAENRREGSKAELRHLVYADPDKMDAVKRALKNAFGGNIDIVQLAPEDDPMQAIAAELRPPKPAEEETDEPADGAGAELAI